MSLNGELKHAFVRVSYASNTVVPANCNHLQLAVAFRVDLPAIASVPLGRWVQNRLRRALAKRQYQHVIDVDPQECWQTGWKGFLLRLRGLASVSTAKVIVTSLVSLAGYWQIGAGIIVAGAGLVVALFFHRRHYLRERNADKQLHAFFHELRDELPKVIALPKGSNEFALKFDEITQKAVQMTAAYFRSRIGEPSINCAVRLAQTDESGTSYVTCARSDGMEPARKQMTKSIPADKGLASFLRSADSRGVLLIPDISEASKQKIWEPCPSDSLSDVQFLMVAPINGVEGTERAMMGMLYVTARNDVFQVFHTVQLKAFADALGMVYTVIQTHVAASAIRQAPARKQSKK